MLTMLTFLFKHSFIVNFYISYVSFTLWPVFVFHVWFYCAALLF